MRLFAFDGANSSRRSAARSLLGTADDVGINPKEARMS
jgi:hypothetical protein